MPGFLKRRSVTETFVYHWIIPNYREIDQKYKANELLRSEFFFLEDGTEWFLDFFPNGQPTPSGGPDYIDGYCSLYLWKETSSTDSEVCHSFLVMKQDSSTLLLHGPHTRTFSNSEGWGSNNLLKRGDLLKEGSEFLQADGSLHLQCEITMDAAYLGGAPCKVAGLRFSHDNSDFTIISPGGKLHQVRLSYP